MVCMWCVCVHMCSWLSIVDIKKTRGCLRLRGCGPVHFGLTRDFCKRGISPTPYKRVRSTCRQPPHPVPGRLIWLALWLVHSCTRLAIFSFFTMAHTLDTTLTREPACRRACRCRRRPRPRSSTCRAPLAWSGSGTPRSTGRKGRPAPSWRPSCRSDA